MTSGEREQRLAFLGLTEDDAQLLRALRPVLEPQVDAIVETFYAHLLKFPATAELLRDTVTIARIKQIQRDYLLRITEGIFDEAYFANRLRIGQAHERVGLSSRWYLLEHGLLFNLLTPLIRQHFTGDPGRADATIAALEKVFMLDAALATEAYIASDRHRHLQQLDSIVNDSADVIFSLDMEGHFRSWNRAAERVFGWLSEEILGRHLSEIIPPELLRQGELVQIERDILGHGHCHLETRRLAKDGREVPVEVMVSLLRDPQGNPIGRSAILRDITERKRLEEDKLQSERLAVIGTMSARLAHEIRNPLSSVTLNLELIRDEVAALTHQNPATGGEARELLRALDSEVKRVQRVTEDYLKFARLPRPRCQPVALNELLDQQLGFMNSSFAANHVKLVTDFAGNLPVLQADEDQLWQAVLNLIRNALEAMPTGGTLTVRTAARDGWVGLSIADTGKGMTEEERQNLFKPFFSTKVGGTGLGLPLTQQVVVEHAGTIRCESAPGTGTTFVIELPTQ